MQIVEVIPSGGDWVEAERWWIAYLQSQGHKLTNLSNGGEGECGRIPTPEVLAKISASLKGHQVTTETRSKLRMAAQQQYINWTPEQKAEHAAKSKRPETEAKRLKCQLVMLEKLGSPKPPPWLKMIGYHDWRDSYRSVLKLIYPTRGDEPDTPSLFIQRRTRVLARPDRGLQHVLKIASQYA